LNKASEDNKENHAMSLTSECLIGEAIRSVDDVIVYQADHPIHGIVNVYLPDEALPPELARAVKRRLYQNGLRMRSLSLLNLPLVTRALEVSQNPNEPYIVTKSLKHDLEELISNGVTIKPKRMFGILSQVLQAIINLATNGWEIDHIHPRQIKLVELHTGDISFTVIEGAGQKTNMTRTATAAADGELSDTTKPQGDDKEDRAFAPTAKITQRIDEPRTEKVQGENRTPKATTPAYTAHDDIGRTATLDESAQLKYAQKRLRMTQRNIYFLGNITYQLLFGRKYEPSDKVVAANIRKLSRRWRKILDKALSQNLDYRYDTYETMLRDVRKASSRNKRVAIASIPFLLLLVIIGSYFAYEQYHEYKIMTSEAGQAIESFLDIVNKTNDTFPELKKPEPASPRPDDQTILEPFEKIEPVDED
jgi:serine/threonine protein kinase